ncbi:trigger factor [Fumia xinanensis]|uniref:Trigger factor n=1 Tax=Fumia xinanensis TaxID=2763659 RepID=A0A926I1T8_9FIRM|nr:trigger factor [Fumia xinanensis]MBC8558838.1 trigger factor [Fumia xinanensis]PWL44445.1 MAG: trigger factor [Clostridiales bacterium]
MSLVSKNNVATNKFELEVHVPAEEFEKACQSAYLKRVKKIEVPGFRKGKAPRKTIEKLYGEGIFFEDAINAVYPSALEAAVEEAGLELVARPMVDVTDVSKEDGFKFKAVCVVKPEVSVKDYKGIKVSKEVKEVTDEDIDKEIDRLRNRNARTISVSDRAAQNDDVVVIDFDGSVDGVPFDGGKAEKFELTLGSGQFIPGFEDQIVGHNVGDEFDVNVKFPEDYHAEELKGKDSVFKVKIHEINAKELPEVDDEFAKDVSEFDTLAEMKDDIKNKLAEQNEKTATTEFENKLIDQVIANMEGEIPEEMYESRIDEMVRDFDYRLRSQGMDINVYLQYTGMDMDAFRLTFKEQAEKQVKIRLALEKVVELEKIETTAEDLEKEYQRIADSYNMELDKVKTMLPAADLMADVAVNKAVDLIKESAVKA